MNEKKEYLVTSHLGGYYISSLDPVKITAICEECGDSDWIVLSWQEEHIIEAFTEYFSNIKMNDENIMDYYKDDVTKFETIQIVLHYYEETSNIISMLFENNKISEEEKRLLLKMNHQSIKSQIALVCEIYDKEHDINILKKKIKNNN